MAAGDIKQAFGTAGTLTCTLQSLANGSGRESTAVNNATNLYLDALVLLKVKTGASGVSATGVVEVYAYGSIDGGTTYTDGVTGADAAATPVNARLLDVMSANANATTFVGGPWSIARAFDGVMPQQWGIIVKNNTGAALDSTEGNHAKQYIEVYTTVAQS